MAEKEEMYTSKYCVDTHRHPDSSFHNATPPINLLEAYKFCCVFGRYSFRKCTQIPSIPTMCYNGFYWPQHHMLTWCIQKATIYSSTFKFIVHQLFCHSTPYISMQRKHREINQQVISNTTSCLNVVICWAICERATMIVTLGVFDRWGKLPENQAQVTVMHYRSKLASSALVVCTYLIRLEIYMNYGRGSSYIGCYSPVSY